MHTCSKYGRKHEVRYLDDFNVCFGFGKMNHNISGCIWVAKNKRDDHRWAQPNSLSNSSGSQKKNMFYALQSRHEKEGSTKVVIDMLKVFQLDVHFLINLGATLYFCDVTCFYEGSYSSRCVVRIVLCLYSDQ